ncbi:MAG: hypothetical protein EBZ78_10420 [Verrucomicrobia bacterium]|nr:hypothetical protein [Verrucomicrobiota bacterium]
MIGPRVGVRGPNPLEPRQGRGKRNETSKRVPSAGGEKRLVPGGESANKLERSRLTIFDESVK